MISHPTYDTPWTRTRGRVQRALPRLLVAALALGLAPGPAAEPSPAVRLTTNLGVIDIALHPTQAPVTTENFLRLVDEGFYDGLIFHRVIANFMIQAGGFDAQMSYREPPGTVANESANGLRNVRGSVAMARRSDPDSAGAQFFINMKDNEHLDAARGRPGYTVFGRVIAGMGVAEAIELSDTQIVDGMAGVPVTPIVIESARRL